MIRHLFNKLISNPLEIGAEVGLLGYSNYFFTLLRNLPIVLENDWTSQSSLLSNTHLKHWENIGHTSVIWFIPFVQTIHKTNQNALLGTWIQVSGRVHAEHTRGPKFKSQHYLLFKLKKNSSMQHLLKIIWIYFAFWIVNTLFCWHHYARNVFPPQGDLRTFNYTTFIAALVCWWYEIRRNGSREQSFRYFANFVTFVHLICVKWPWWRYYYSHQDGAGRIKCFAQDSPRICKLCSQVQE